MIKGRTAPTSERGRVLLLLPLLLLLFVEPRAVRRSTEAARKTAPTSEVVRPLRAAVRQSTRQHRPLRATTNQKV